jgi:hypothetical protein
VRRDWRSVARDALQRLEGVAHGEREREMQLAARQLSEHEDTTALRRSILAHGFLTGLEKSDPQMAGYLAEAPLSIAEVFARWDSFDHAGAREAARAWWEGRETVRSLTEQMRKRRPKGFYGKTGGTYEREYAVAAEPAVTKAVHAVVGATVSIAEKGGKAAGGLSVDFVFVTQEDEARRIAVLIVGPYSVAKNFVTKATDWVTRAYGLAWLYDVVVLAVPNADVVQAFDARNSTMREAISGGSDERRRTPNVVVVPLFVDPFTEEDHAALGALGE